MASFAILFLSSMLGPQDPAEEEDRIKAAFLYSFSKFVVWPDEKFAHGDSPIVLGMIGRDFYGMTDLLREAAANRGRIQGRPFKVVRLEYVPVRKSAREDFEARLRQCHLIYMGQLARKKQLDIFEVINDHCVLSVGDDGFAEMGGMVALVRRGDRVMFRISMDSVSRECMVISPKVLMNAEIIGK